MTQVPTQPEQTPNPNEVPEVSDTQEMSVADINAALGNQSTESPETNPTQPLGFIPSAVVEAPTPSRTKRNIFVAAGAGLALATAFLGGKMASGHEGDQPTAQETNLGQPTPNASTSTAEQTPSASPSPTDLPSETKSVPVVAPSSPNATETPSASETTTAAPEKAPEFVKYTSDPLPELNLSGEALIDALRIKVADNPTPEDAFSAYFKTLSKWDYIGCKTSLSTIAGYQMPGNINIGSTVWVEHIAEKYNEAFLEALIGPTNTNQALVDRYSKVGMAVNLMHQAYADALADPNDPGTANEIPYKAGIAVKLKKVDQEGDNTYKYVYDSYGFDNAGENNVGQIRARGGGYGGNTDINTPNNLVTNATLVLQKSPDGQYWYVAG